MSVQPGVELHPITHSDVRPVAHFLHDNLNGRLSATGWAEAILPPWRVDSPNHGFLLRTDSGAIVGVYLAYYSERTFEGEILRFCNLAAWCVLDDFRAHSLRLLRAVLAQKNYEFTDLSPSGNVVPLNTRLRFNSLDTATAMVPNLPWPPSRKVRLLHDPGAISRTLKGPDLDVYRDHEYAAAARHLVLQLGARTCYVMFRKDRRKNLPLFASILYVSEPEVFRLAARHVFRHLLVRHGVLATLAERRVTGPCPGPAFSLRAPRPKMYRSSRLRPEQIDYLYSELTCVAW